MSENIEISFFWKCFFTHIVLRMHQIDGSTDVQIIHHDDGIRNVGSRYYSVYTMDIYAQNARNECISNTERLKYTVLQLYEPFNVFSYHMKDY